MMEHIPAQLIKNKNATELKVELVNGSIIQLMGADEFKKSGVGTNPVGVVFSEYALNAPDAWTFLSPILAQNGGWAIFNFTPRGKNHAWELLQKAKSNPLWFTQILTADDTQVFTQEILDEEKRNNPEAIFSQEYYCNFTENAGQFFRRVRENVYDAATESEADHDYQLGVDLAKYQDYTVITPFDLQTFEVHQQDRFNQVDWNLQKSRIEASARKYNNARVKIDRTGVGDPIVEDLQAKGLNIGDEDAIAFTEQSRMNLLNNLSMMLEQDKIRIPNEEGLIAELESFQYILTPRGKLRVQAPDTMHDDRVMSLALAVYGATNQYEKPNRIRTGTMDEYKLYATTYE
ncbi:MAG: phage terminase large subunit family protein [Minisyncoccota bacterium]